MHLASDPSELHRLIRENAREEWKPSIQDADEWLSDPAHFALVEGSDLAMFEAKHGWPGPLHGHIFFASRGKAALAVAKAMLDHAFDYGATEIRGETPMRFRDALLFIRLLGFRPYGEEVRRGEKVILSHKYPEPKSVA